MNEQIQRYLQMGKEFWESLSFRKKIWLGLSTLTILAVGIGSWAIVSHDPMQILFSDLQPEETRSIVKKLSELNILHKISQDQTSLFVPESKIDEVRIQLAKEGLPTQDLVGFEKFDTTSTIGMSNYVQKIQYVRAVQGELIRSIQRLASVKRARVHISIPPKKTFLDEEEPPKASVILELKRGQSPSKPEVQGIAHLVASAVEGLKVSQVSIVDSSGKFLLRPEDQNQIGLSNTLLEIQRSLEIEYEKRIEDLLSPVVGMNKVKAKVAVEIDPARTNTTEESFDPEKTAIRSNIKNEEISQGTRQTAMGIPGARSNLPGTENSATNSPTATNNVEKNTQNTNYAVPRKIHIVDKPSGNIKRLTVAVLVDGQYSKASEGNQMIFTPRPDEELKRFQEIVSNSVGFDPERRDSITVTSMPFSIPAEDTASPGSEQPVSWRSWFLESRNWLPMAVRFGGVILVLLLTYLTILLPIRSWTKPKVEKVVAPVESLPKTVAEVEELHNEGRLTAFAETKPQAQEQPEVSSTVDTTPTPLKEKESEKEVLPEVKRDLRKEILEKLANSPKKGFRVIQDWMEEKISTSMVLEDGVG